MLTKLNQETIDCRLVEAGLPAPFADMDALAVSRGKREQVGRNQSIVDDCFRVDQACLTPQR
ncbi:MAG: hypothetical protein Fur0046_31640 [Cyanobacteria bacterium J069]